MLATLMRLVRQKGHSYIIGHTIGDQQDRMVTHQ